MDEEGVDPHVYLYNNKCHACSRRLQNDLDGIWEIRKIVAISLALYDSPTHCRGGDNNNNNNISYFTAHSSRTSV